MRYKVLVPFGGNHVCEMQNWCKDFDMKHDPTEKHLEKGYVFSFYKEEDAVAFKLKWVQ